MQADHKLRVFSEDDSGIMAYKKQGSAESQRDYLIEYFYYLTTTHFGPLIERTTNDESLIDHLFDTLSELTTNGIYHSETDVFVMMFNTAKRCSCSISDYGKGLYKSMETKASNSYYETLGIVNELKNIVSLKMSIDVQHAGFAIFETLYYSMLKSRNGLFDLVLSIVLDFNGTFRIHNESVQVVVSARMHNELSELRKLRLKIYDCHALFNMEKTTEKEFLSDMLILSRQAKSAILQLANNLFIRYTLDIQYSAIRILSVKLKGVHIETEIPKI
jgi:hypothetical protein